MAPSRKQKHIKPRSLGQSGYVHPSLRKSEASHSHLASRGARQPQSVNERLESLRRSQSRRVQTDRWGRLPDSQFAPPSPPSRRRIPGPPPPRSWTERSPSPESRSTSYTRRRTQDARPPLDYLPGIDIPDGHSLVHHVLKTMASDIQWHIEIDHFFLCLLPARLKMQLLSYVARYGLDSSFTVRGLRRMFASLHESNLVEPETANDQITRLDLGNSLGYDIDFADLSKFWTFKTLRGSLHKHSAKDPRPVLHSLDTAPTTWDEPQAYLLSQGPSARFSNLTHLSLAYPPSTISWTDLLAFSRHLVSITHLSIAGWPRPQLSESSALLTSLAPQSVKDESTLLRSDTKDGDEESCFVLRGLNRNTPSLEYLDISDCHDWFRLMRFEPSREVSSPLIRMNRLHISARPLAAFEDGATKGSGPSEFGVDWVHSWNLIKEIKICQSASIPEDVPVETLAFLLDSRGRAAPVSSHSSENGIEPWFDDMHMPEHWNSEESRLQRRHWSWREREGVRLECHIRRTRANATGTRLNRLYVDYGWNKSDLMHIHDEVELFRAGI